MLNLLKKLMLLRQLILVIWLKKLTETQKLINHDKYITTNSFNKFSGTIFDER